jgi:hypothetical protein
MYIQKSVHERLGTWTIRFTIKFSEHKASRMTYCVSSYEHASRPTSRSDKAGSINFLVRQRPTGSEAESSGAKRQKKEKESPSKQ